MTAEQFAYWMQGFSELNGDETPTPAQWKMMKEHLATVFVKVTPPLKADPINPSKVQPIPGKWPTQFPQDWHPGLTPNSPQRPFDPLRPLIATCSAGVSAPNAGTSTC